MPDKLALRAEPDSAERCASNSTHGARRRHVLTLSFLPYHLTFINSIPAGANKFCTTEDVTSGLGGRNLFDPSKRHHEKADAPTCRFGNTSVPYSPQPIRPRKGFSGSVSSFLAVGDDENLDQQHFGGVARSASLTVLVRSIVSITVAVFWKSHSRHTNLNVSSLEMAIKCMTLRPSDRQVVNFCPSLKTVINHLGHAILIHKRKKNTAMPSIGLSLGARQYRRPRSLRQFSCAGP